MRKPLSKWKRLGNSSCRDSRYQLGVVAGRQRHAFPRAAIQQKPIGAPPRDRANPILDPVVIDRQRAIVKESRQRLPTSEAIVDRIGDPRFVGRLLPLQKEPFTKLVGDRLRLKLPCSLSLSGAQFPCLAFDLVELSEQLQCFLGQGTLWLAHRSLNSLRGSQRCQSVGVWNRCLAC